MKKRDERMTKESLKQTMKQMFQANDRNRQSVERSIGREIGYPVVSTFPTGVSDGFIVFNTMSRRLHMYDGTTWAAIGDVGAYIALMQSIIGLTAFWPINSFDQSANVYDLSGQGRTLTYNAGSLSVINNRLTTMTFNGTTAYWSRADEAGLDFGASLTFGFWYKFSATGTQVIMSKFAALGQRSFELQYVTGTGFRMIVTGDGSTNVIVTSSDPAPGTTNWYHFVGRFQPSTEIAIFVNGVKTANTTSIPAAIFNSTSALNFGRRADATFYASGDLTMAFMSRSNLNDAYINALYEEGLPLFT